MHSCTRALESGALHAVAENDHMLGRQAADLFQECAAEGSHIGIAAGIGDHGEGIIRIAHEKPGLGNAVGIDILPEIDMHLFSKKWDRWKR